jgi:hypothetical protein
MTNTHDTAVDTASPRHKSNKNALQTDMQALEIKPRNSIRKGPAIVYIYIYITLLGPSRRIARSWQALVIWLRSGSPVVKARLCGWPACIWRHPNRHSGRPAGRFGRSPIAGWPLSLPLSLSLSLSPSLSLSLSLPSFCGRTHGAGIPKGNAGLGNQAQVSLSIRKGPATVYIYI